VPEDNQFVLTAASLGIGGVLAAGLYGFSSGILTESASSILPALGAIVIASTVPMVLMRHAMRRDARRSEMSLAQRLAVLDRHAVWNVVDVENRLTEFNDQLLELTGYTREELVGQQVSMLYDPEHQQLSQTIRTTLLRGLTWQGETPLRRADGSIFYTNTTVMPLYDEKGRWCGSISARTDVTQHHKLSAQRDTALTLHELRDDVWIVDEQTLEFRYMNRSAMARFGWPEEVYGGKSLMDLALKSDAAAILDVCADLHRSGEPLARREMAVLGSHFDVTVKLLRDGPHEGRFLILLNDISDRLAQEQVKADFVSMVSHELRSPLTSIKGSMGLLLSGAAGPLPDKARNLLDISHRNADRLVLIINDILDLEKITTGRMDFSVETVNMSELVNEAIAASAIYVKNFGQKLRTSGLEQDITIRTDPNRVIQVLTNLISNASKFSEPNDTIHITCEARSDGVRVSVRDEGVGIPAKDQHKIFKRFADLSNSDRSSKGGTGLGLSICQAIVENLGGSIGFRSQPGTGTTFHFTLPSSMVDADADTARDELRSAG
jgi:PAS domain S-box-containing protein